MNLPLRSGLLAVIVWFADSEVLAQSNGPVPASWRVATAKFPSPQTVAMIASPSSKTKRWYQIHVDVNQTYEPMVALTVDKVSTGRSLQSGTSALVFGSVISVALSDGAEAGTGSASILSLQALDELRNKKLNWRAVAAARFGSGQVPLRPLTLAMLDVPRDVRISFEAVDKECVGVKASIVLDRQPATDGAGAQLTLVPGNSVIVRGGTVDLVFQGTCPSTVGVNGFWSLVDGASVPASE